MPHYKKAFDIGTYTGNGGQYRVGIPTLRGVGPSNGQVANSLRFRASNSNYITRTPAASGNRKTWTFSCWFKKTANGGNVGLFSTYGSSSDTTAGGIVFGSSDQIYFMAWGTIWRRTTLAFKDSSRWYHLVIAFDTTQATASNRVKMYIDGSRVDSFAASTDPALNTDYGFNTNNHHEFGAWIPTATSGYSYLDMYLAETYFLDGYAYDASYFGEFNSDGIWVPKTYSGLYGTNGFYLKFAPGAAGTDSSGNNNTWTLSGHNVTTANTTYDIVTDSPCDYLSGSMSTANNAGNYCVLNYWQNGTNTLSNGNLNAAGSASTWRGTQGTVFASSGKWYYEATVTAMSTYANIICGIGTATASMSSSSYPGSTSLDWGVQFAVSGVNSYKINAGSFTAITNATYAVGDVFMIAYDIDAGKFWLGKNGTWIESGNPSTGANALFTNVTGKICPQIGLYNSTESVAVNFGQRAFSYTPPTGFNAINTYNIPRPADSSLWFYGDTPDLMWIKNRSTTGYHIITDTVRGMGLYINSQTTGAENSGPAVVEMNKFGMTVLNEGTYLGNGNGNSHVYWTWKRGPGQGFDIVSYTGNGTSVSVAHSLGAAPSFIITKCRNAAQNWNVYHKSLGTSYYLRLNTSDAQVNYGGYINPTSSVVFYGGLSEINTNGNSYISYLFSEIPGYSAFGSWIGSGGADGPYIYLGFKPKFVLYKRSDTLGNDWTIHDSTRDYYNGYSVELYPSLSNAEGGPYSPPVFDFVSNGLKIRSGTASYTNTSGGNYVYAAFAENPFKFARAR